MPKTVWPDGKIIFIAFGHFGRYNNENLPNGISNKPK